MDLFGEDVVRGEIFLSMGYPKWGKVKLGSVQLIELCDEVFPRWGKVELVDLSGEGVVHDDLFLDRSITYLVYGKVMLG